MHILVHLHLFYLDQLGFFIDQLSHITEPDWHLVVSWNSSSKRVKKQILSFKPDTEFFEIENNGYDVWPFIKVMSLIDISGYDYIIKLHTKGPAKPGCRVNGASVSGFKWRNQLVRPLLGTVEAFEEMNRIFETEAKTGLVCSIRLYSSMVYKEDHQPLTDELQRLGVNTSERRFCAGTIFAIRPAILEPVLRRGLSASDFPGHCVSHTGGTLAHVYERVLSILPAALGYEVHPVGTTASYRLRSAYHRHVENVFRWIFSLDRKGDNLEKYLTVFGMNFKLDNGYNPDN